MMDPRQGGGGMMTNRFPPEVVECVKSMGVAFDPTAGIPANDEAKRAIQSCMEKLRGGQGGVSPEQQGGSRSGFPSANFNNDQSFMQNPDFVHCVTSAKESVA